MRLDPEEDREPPKLPRLVSTLTRENYRLVAMPQGLTIARSEHSDWVSFTWREVADLVADIKELTEKHTIGRAA